MKKLLKLYYLLFILFSLAIPITGESAPVSALVDLAKVPLTGSSGAVKPNLMFVFDTSLSMSQEISGDYLASNFQCKMAPKNRTGTLITGLTRGPTLNNPTASNTTLTITAPGHGLGVGTVVYLAIPGNPDFNGVYTITKRNLTTTSSTCNTYNTTTTVNNPTCNGARSANPTADPPVLACACNAPTPSNVPNTSADVNLTVPGSTDPSVCRWRDPRDNAPGTVCTSSTPGVTTGDDTLEVTVLNAGTFGIFSPTQILDARIMSRSDTTACTASAHEPPIAASEVNGLYYNPNVRYLPAPSPANLTTNLPSMNRANSVNWTKVRSNGLSLTAAGVQNSSQVDITKWADMVYCDTPNRPAAFLTDNAWFTSSRCKSNDLTTNSVASSPNYPYPYPNTVDGGVSNPSKTNFYANNNLRQQLATIPSATNPVAGSFPYGKIYSAANPFYYNIRPIEYCTSSKLNDCRLGAASGSYQVPSYVRYCKTAVAAYDTSVNPAITVCQSSNTGTAGTDFQYARYGLFERVEIKSGSTYPPSPAVKSAERLDCSDSSSCTYDEEMTNFANWYAYYRTRLQLMKSTAGSTFNTLDNNYRVGLITVEGQTTAGNYLPISDFVAGVGLQKVNWFNTLYSRAASGGTALRVALSSVGQIFAGKHPITGFVADDPVQYSCQQNYTLLTTDGYWNGDPGTTVTGSSIGNQDSTAAPPLKEVTTAPDTLADVAMYYYQTDLRNSAFSNCTGSLGDDICFDDVRQGANQDTAKTQHMTTFTLGLGIDGKLNYVDKYEDSTSGDFFDIKNNGAAWPLPVSNQISAVDDLWHAAVNGRGTYFSAKNPQQLTTSLLSTLQKITNSGGTNSATAVSNVTPTSDDNYAFSARYISGEWTGNIFARTVNSSGILSDSAVWCAETEKASVTPECAGTLNARVALESDTRTIWTNVDGVLTPFQYGNLSDTQKAYFKASYLNETVNGAPRLSQWAAYTAYQLTQAGQASLVNYLRGQFKFDDRASNNITLPTPQDNRLYRERTAVLGDIIDSDPTYVGKPSFQYVDPGYNSFVASVSAARATTKTVFVGANDGMLHAFDALTGAERWAYVPDTLIPTLYKLADKNYRNTHTNYVNGEIIVADICVSGCSTGGVWKTILVGGLGQGGRGYFALDITDLTAPQLLWEVNNKKTGFDNLGFSYGKPVITKKSDGTWIVALTSGYNNISTGNGKGSLFILDAYSGTLMNEISTGVGSTSVPSGLAQVLGYAVNPSQNNLSKYIYGGDLLGNLWRFDIDLGTAFLVVNLKDAGDVSQPISVTPTLGRINGKRIIYIGTGKYLEKSDLLPATYSRQTLYAIKDDDLTSAIPNLRTTSVPQILNGGNTTRSMSTTSPVDFSTSTGWYIDLPASGERQVVKSQLSLGILFVPTLVPPTGTCDSNGKGYLNAIDYKTGGAVEGTGGIVSTSMDSPITGLNLLYHADVPGLITVTHDSANGIDATGSAGRAINEGTGGNGGPTWLGKFGTGGFSGNRAIWRELQ